MGIVDPTMTIKTDVAEQTDAKDGEPLIELTTSLSVPPAQWAEIVLENRERGQEPSLACDSQIPTEALKAIANRR